MGLISQSLMGEPLDWGFYSTRSKIIRVGNSELWALNRIGSCETQALGLEYHLGQKPCEPQALGMGLFFKMTRWVLRVRLGF